MSKESPYTSGQCKEIAFAAANPLETLFFIGHRIIP
jgi:hypothetical protein